MCRCEILALFRCAAAGRFSVENYAEGKSTDDKLKSCLSSLL